MKRVSIMTAAVISTGLFTVASFAADRTGPLPTVNYQNDVVRVAPPLPVKQPQIRLAQSNDATYRVNELENEVRRLNGRIEELTFQLLEMQERIRKMQEDNELRFQDLEDKSSDAGSNIDGSSKENKLVATKQPAEEQSLGKPEPSRVDAPDGNQTTKQKMTAASSRPLGTLTFDENGNVVDRNRTGEANGGKIAALPLPGVFSDGVEGGITAAEFGPTPSAVFSVGKSALERKRYDRADNAFRAFLKAWPNDPRTGEARFYLGEALFWKGDYFQAANIHLDTHNAHPNAKTAADNLLALGLSLAGLNQREVACVTYGEVLKQYPSASSRLGQRIKAEQASTQC